MDYAVGQLPAALVAATLRPEGETDLVLVNSADSFIDWDGGGVTVLLGNEQGSFAALPTQDEAAPDSLAAADFNGDGRVDLAVVTKGGQPTFDNGTSGGTGSGSSSGGGVTYDGAIHVHLGNGDGTFQEGTTYITAPFPTAVAIGDFNGDGHPDLAVTGLSEKNSEGSSTGGPNDVVGILEGNGDGTFQPEVDFNVGLMPTDVEIGDFNGDGILDLAVAGSEEGTVTILLGDGAAGFTPAPTLQAEFDLTHIAVADYNRDGNLDLAVSYGPVWAAAISVFLGNGDGTFQPSVDYPTGACPLWLASGDLDGDGRPDLVVANNLSNSVSVLMGNGDGTFALPGDLSHRRCSELGSPRGLQSRWNPRPGNHE